MSFKEARLTALLALLGEDVGPERGKKARLAKRIGKSAAQVSQWLSGYRTIDDESARAIEQSAGKPCWWMDGGSTDTAISVAHRPQPLPSLEAALATLGNALAQSLDDDARDDVGDALRKLALRRGAERDQQLVLTLLRSSTKRQDAA